MQRDNNNDLKDTVTAQDAKIVAQAAKIVTQDAKLATQEEEIEGLKAWKAS
eukprot:CAMPEP_0197556252 /NCGR_PEP_ID=MMETSP1320-20131121/14813_1 /TAXON_ID=91990 /ORGANISM="Bolidomonas sp., Strain RCC2347" /LENGTH=50 /DNA_ID=CAMNT_0043117361 /DNA_START=57 /DNA_END=206 /DNA_ORIENTATION=+